MKHQRNNQIKQFYEIILLRNGGQVERIKTPNYITFKGEYERMESVANSNSAYDLIANLYDADNQFEKRIK